MKAINEIKNHINAVEPTQNNIVTILDWVDYISGEITPSTKKIEQELEAAIEYDICQYFYYNNLPLLDRELTVELTTNYRSQEFLDVLKIDLYQEYNPLQEYLAGDFTYYFNVEPLYYYQVEEEVLDFLTWYVVQYGLVDNKKQTLTTGDILQVIKYYLDKDHQELLRQCNYQELFEDIIDAYDSLIRDLQDEIEEAIQEKYQELYHNIQDTAETEILQQIQAGELQY